MYLHQVGGGQWPALTELHTDMYMYNYTIDYMHVRIQLRPVHILGKCVRV